MNINAPASVLWHDAFSTNVKAIDPRYQVGFATKDRSLDEMADHVLAGYIQFAISKLPENLRLWGSLCFSPDDATPGGTFEGVMSELLTAYKLKMALNGRDPDRHADRLERMAEKAIEHQVYYSRVGAAHPGSIASVCQYCGIHPSNWQRYGYQIIWGELRTILSNWTGLALKPIGEIRDKQLNRNNGEVAQQQ